MNSLKPTISFLAVLLCLCVAQYAMAKRPHITAKYTTIAVNQTSTVYDQSLSGPDYTYLETHAPSTLVTGEKYWTNGATTWYDKEVKNRLIFYIEPEKTCINSAFTATITVELKKYNWYSGTYTYQTENKTLTLNYDPANVFSKRVVYEFPAGYKLVSRITALSTSNASYNSMLGLETEFEAERYFGFDHAANTPSGLTCSSTPVSDKSEYLVTWDEMIWAEEYDLEWTFVDYYSELLVKNTDGTIDTDGSMLPGDFSRFNSTRITTTNTYYNIPAVYGKGVILYRVRGYGKSSEDQFVQKIPGIWSTELDGVHALGDFAFFETDGHELQMNWQFSTVFAEEGKNKISLKYYDGSMRQRQEVSKMNTGIMLQDPVSEEYTRMVRNSLVSEIIYDHQGRPAINVLPVPTDQEQLRFYDQFNRNPAGTGVYDKTNFDIDRLVPCAIAADEMSSGYGASNYYSENNVFLTTLAPPQMNQTAQFIPDAQLYPFIHTQYMPDNTGKILAKSGAGADHQIGTGHETRYFYGRPFQEELDRLFGAEAGYAEHYKKNVTLDANGQLSISYLNMQDKVVATTLTGPVPEQVSKVETYKTGNDGMDVDLLNKVLPGDAFGKAETFNLDERTRTLSQDFFVADEGIRDFRYKLINDKYTEMCLEKTFCYECVLDLKISIKNECGVQFLNGLGTEGGSPVTTLHIDRTHVTDSGKTTTNNCLGSTEVIERGNLSTPWKSNTSGTPVSMKKGTYTMVKTLTVNQAALDIYTQNFLDSNECLQAQKQLFIEEEMAKIDTSFCTFDCSEWLEKIGATWAESPLNPAVTPGSEVTEEAYNALYSSYLEDCDQSNRQCKAAYEMMLQDVSPLGQYGEVYTRQTRYDVNGKLMMPDYQTFSPQSHPLSVFNENNYLPWKDVVNTTYLPLLSGVPAGMPYYWPSWRFPYNHTQTDPDKKSNYLDRNGELAYIYLEKGEDGAYTPAVYGDDFSLVEYDAEGRPRILVKFLADVKDLVDAWDPAWAKSLVAYHPEYLFYIDCISKVESNQFDNDWLEVNSVEDANVKLIDPYTGKNWAAPLGTTYSSTDILDPFFDYTKNLDFADDPVSPTGMNATGILFYNAVKYKLEHFIVSSSVDLTMQQAAIIIANCPDIDLEGCPGDLSTCLAYRSYVSTPEEWRVYRQLYYSVKQRAAEALSLKKSISTGYYNGCIGEEVFNVARNWFYYAPYNAPGTIAAIPHPWFSFMHQMMSWAIPKQQFFNPDQPCNWARYWLYKNKNVRYRQTEALYDIDALKSKNANFALAPDALLSFGDNYSNNAIIEEAKKIAGVATYKANCGQCPVAESMVELLNAFKRKSELITSYHFIRSGCGYSLTPDYAEMTPELAKQIVSDYVPASSGIQYMGEKYSSGGYNYFKAYFMDDNANTKTITFRFPYGSPYDADDIERFCCIRGNTALANPDNFDFKVTVFVKLKSGDPDYAANEPALIAARETAGIPLLSEITLEATSEQIDLIHCDNLPLCKPSAEARFMLNFLNASIAMPLHSASVQASVKRNTSGVLVISQPWQETFTDALAKALFTGYNSYFDEYFWSTYISSTSSTTQVLDGSFTYKSMNKGVRLTLFRDPANLAISEFQYIRSFNSITPKLGFPNVAVIKATACSSNVCILLTIEMDLGFAAGTCTAGLPDGLKSGEPANNNKVKPDIGSAADYGVSTLTPPWEVVVNGSTDSLPAPDSPCTNAASLKNFILGTVKNSAARYDSTQWSVEWNPCPFGHGWVASVVVPYQQVTPLPCSDCGMKIIFPSIGYTDENGNPMQYTMQNVVSVDDFRTISAGEYEVDVTTHDGKKITLRIRLENCGLPETVTNIDKYAGGGGTGSGDGEGKCRPTEVLNFHNFSAYFNNIPEWDEVYGEYIIEEGHNYFFDGYEKDFTTDLDTNRRYRFDSVTYSNWISSGYYSIVALGESYKFLNYGTCNYAMRYRNTLVNTWEKIWESAGNVSIKKDTAYTFSVWHKELNPYASSPDEESKLQIFFADTQASCIRTIFRSGADFWVRYDVLLLSPTNRSGKIRIETKSSGSRECLLTGIQLLRDCGPTYCCPMPMPPMVVENPCHEQLESIALENANIRYQEYLKPFITEFQQGYINKCLHVYEEFYMKYEDSEDHTTLYYYDQAGNLVRTIPPNGVVKITDDGKLARIKEDRAKGLRREFTDHEFKTTYTYNSLNQLQYQSMPDNENMPVWNALVKNNGIPASYTIKDIRFTDKRNGVLVANSSTAGHIYKTSDGGENWSEINAFGLADINSIATDNYTGVGSRFVVGDKGLVMLYLPSSMQWNIKVLPTAEKLVKVNMVSSEVNVDFTLIHTTVWVHDEKGVAWRIKATINLTGYVLENWEYEGPYTGLSEVATGKIEDVHIPFNTPYSSLSLIGYAVTDNGKIYRTDDEGYTWQPDISAITLSDNLTAMHFNASNQGYIGGENGLLLKGALVSGTSLQPARWRIVPGNLTTNITKLHFHDAENGFVLGADFNLYRTKDGGTIFTDLNITEDVTDFTFSGTTLGWLVTKNGKIYRTADGGLTWNLYSQVLSSGTPVYGSGNEAQKIRYAAGAVRSYLMVTGTTSVHYIYMNAPATWKALSVAAQIGGGTISDVFIGQATDSLKVNMLVSDGNIKAYSAVSAGWSSLYGSGDAAKLFFITPEKGAIWCTDGKIKYYNSATLLWEHRLTVAAINAFAYSPDFANLVVVKNAGQIYASEGAAATTLLNLSAGIYTPKLNAVQCYTGIGDHTRTVAVSQSGLILFGIKYLGNTYTNWSVKKNAISQALNDVRFNGSYYTVAGNNGVAFTTTHGSIPGTLTTATSTDYHAVAGVNLVAGANGKVYGLPSTTYTTPVTTSTINAGEGNVVVGDNGYIAEKSSTTYTAVNTTIPEKLNALHFVTALVGFAGGENGSLWKTTDGGKSWQDIKITALSTRHINGISFLNETTGFVVATNGNLYKTTDGGTTFTSVSSGTSNDLMGIDINSTGLGYIVGKSGTYLKTTNSGTSWTLASVSGSPDLNSVSVPDYNLAYMCGDNSKLYAVTPSASPVLQEQSAGISWPSFLVSAQRHLKDIYFVDRKTGYVTGQSGFMMKTVDGGITWKLEQSGTAQDVNALSPADEATLYTAGTTAAVTRITDMKDRYASKFYYDALGRLVVSQNTKQYNKAVDHLHYSYTLFDFKGRITEVGELHALTPVESNYNSLGMLDDQQFEAWINAAERTEVTRTYYDVAEFTSRLPLTFTQDNLRNRVASTAYYPVYALSNPVYRSATHYTYDIHGNVSALLQENTLLEDISQSFKRIDYTYDLISGKVLEVAYQHANPDRFYHRYQYDGDNRVVAVETSYDKVVWEKDAKYLYYLHGPLARTELANDQVQGLDYAYTIQGWLKSVNGASLDEDAATTMGADGVNDVNNANRYFGKDEMAYELNYYQGDYMPVQTAALTTFASVTGTDYQAALSASDLFNGNISGMITSHRQFIMQGKNPLATAYGYDQLNRLRQASYFMSTPGEDWASTDSYYNEFNYDANGNITHQTRNGNASPAGPDMDDLTYRYYTGTNKLRHVEDEVGTSVYWDDIDDQLGAENPATYVNYEYDEMGNLVKDRAEEIDRIEWTVSGKIAKIIRITGSSKPDMEFQYDPAGNRIAKIVFPKTGEKLKVSTYYVRDAQGNVMTTYTRVYDKDIDYTSLNFSIVNAALLNLNTVAAFSGFIGWLHVTNNNSNTSFLANVKSNISTSGDIVAGAGAYYGQMMNDIPGLFDDAFGALSASEAMNLYAANLGDPNALQTLLRELCDCYSGVYSFIDLLFDENTPGIGNNSAREIFLTYLYEFDNGKFFDFTDQLGGSSYDFETDLDYLLTVSDPGDWQNAFSNLGYDCDFISAVFAFGYYGGGPYAYYAQFGELFSTLPGLNKALNPNSSTCGITVPDAYLAAYYIASSPAVREYLVENVTSDMTDWLVDNATAFTLDAAINLDPDLITSAQQATTGIYGGMEGYMNLVKQYYGDAFYQSLKNQLMNSYPAYLDNLTASEHYIYGSTRVGAYHPNNLLSQVKFTATLNNGNFSSIVIQNVSNMTTPTGTYSITRGRKQFELSNHLGNVLAVLSDKKKAQCTFTNNYTERFNGGTTGGWINSYRSTLVSNGTEQLNVNGLSGTSQVISPSIAFTIGKQYKLSFDLLNLNTGDYLIVYTMYPHPGYIITWIGANGHHEITFTATAASMQLHMNFQNNVSTGPVTFSLDNIEFNELPGTISSYVADVIQANDYSPFGAPLAGRDLQHKRLDAKVVDLVPGDMKLAGWQRTFCTAPTSCTTPETSVTLVQDPSTGKLKMTASKRYSQAYYTFTTVPGRVYRVKYRLSNSTMTLINTSVFAPVALKELYTSANVGTFGVDREMIFTALENTTRFYITKGWSAAAVTADQDIYLDYLTITEVPEQVNQISCASINDNLVMLTNSGVNVNDTNVLKVYLNAYYNRTYNHADYAAVLNNCDSNPGSYVLAQRGIENRQVEEGYRYGFNGHEKDDEIKGLGNHLSFGDYGYDTRLGRRWQPDPKSLLLPHITPYVFGLNSPIRTIDEDGQFPILINGNTSGGDHERASPTYWNKNILSTISSRTGYKMGASFNGSSASNSRFSGDFFFVDGNKGWGAGTRRTAGVAQAKVDAQAIWNKMKETMKDGKVTEQLQVVTHSRGSAYGEGYMAQMTVEIQKLAEKEGIGFAYDKNSIVEYSVNLAPHQSNSINYGNSGTKNVNISHIGDPFSGDDATGNVVNVQSIPEEDAGPIDQHGTGSFVTELTAVLKTLESGVSKGGLFKAIKNVYQNYDKNRTNGDKSTVTQGGN